MERVAGGSGLEGKIRWRWGGTKGVVVVVRSAYFRRLFAWHRVLFFVPVIIAIKELERIECT